MRRNPIARDAKTESYAKHIICLLGTTLYQISNIFRQLVAASYLQHLIIFQFY